MRLSMGEKKERKREEKRSLLSSVAEHARNSPSGVPYTSGSQTSCWSDSCLDNL